ncbi:hypothetical protein FA13DRAFT_1718699 [Coprinellus micaceus]|uniref:Uncharacterized protein n=1 Tax=Coprinellus micaceus TaxID=71717 RepID=A0A4Y7SCW4_COPMI|nr:hypothetical protein FA13DRAFT_1718699 [Coprinellus micaceus]
MPRSSKKNKVNSDRAARARAGKAARNRPNVVEEMEETGAQGMARNQEDDEPSPEVPANEDLDSEHDRLCDGLGNWDGTVEYATSDSEDEDWWESGSDFTDESDLEEAWDEVEKVPGELDDDLDVDEILQNLREQCS